MGFRVATFVGVTLGHRPRWLTIDEAPSFFLKDPHIACKLRCFAYIQTHDGFPWDEFGLFTDP